MRVTYCDYCGQKVPEGTWQTPTELGSKDLCEKHAQDYDLKVTLAKEIYKATLDAWWEGRKK